MIVDMSAMVFPKQTVQLLWPINDPSGIALWTMTYALAGTDSVQICPPCTRYYQIHLFDDMHAAIRLYQGIHSIKSHYVEEQLRGRSFHWLRDFFLDFCVRDASIRNMSSSRCQY